MKKIYKGLLLAIGSIGLSSLSWGQCFNPAVSFSAGLSPSDIVAGDFNADGKLDLAVSNYNDFGTVSILLATDNGSFSPATSLSVPGIPSNPISIVKGDFNGDGKLDLITANFGQNPNVFFAGALSLLQGTGDGSFGPITRFNGGTDPSFVDVGDFNGDGRPDLVLDRRSIRGDGGFIYTLLNNGSGSFSIGSTLVGLGKNLISVAVGDFNGDGKSDLATANNMTNAVSVLLSSGGAGFNPAIDFAVGSTPTSVIAGDVNSDGKLDLIVNVNTGSGSVLLGTGGGGFSAINAAFVGNVSVVGDFDRDGKPDLAGIDGSSNNSANTVGIVLVLPGNGNGTFGPRVNFTTGSTPTALVAEDFDLDGKLDLVTSNLNDQTVSLLLNCTPPVLAFREPILDCGSGTLTITTNRGNSGLIEFRIAGLHDWLSGFSDIAFVPAYQRSGTRFIIEARQSGRTISVPFITACPSTTPIPPTPPAPPIPPTGSGLTLAAPAYDCTSGLLTLATTGGNGSLVEYRIAGLRDWAAGNAFTIPVYQRTGTSFTLEARQSGVAVSLPFNSACQTTTPPTPPVAKPLIINSITAGCQPAYIQLTTEGGDGTAIEFKVPGLRDWGASPFFNVPAYQRSGTTFTLYARQSGRETTLGYTLKCLESNRLASPETAGGLKVVVYPNPVSEQFNVGVSGASGQLVRFHLTNLQGQTVVEQRAQVVRDQHIETIQLPASGAGLYLLQVSTPTQTKTVKVLKP